MDEFDLFIHTDGSIQGIYSDDLAEVFEGEEARVRRASHVEPSVVNKLFGEPGWIADMSPVGGPLLNDNGRPFKTRQAALDAERAWLDAKMAEGRVEVQP